MSLLRLFITANLLGVFAYAIRNGIEWDLALMVLSIVIGVLVLFDKN